MEPVALPVLVVDDDPDTRVNLCDILEMDGYQVETAGTAEEALRRVREHEYLAIILDRKLPDGTAEEFLPRLLKKAPSAAVLIVTGYGDLQGAIEALRLGTADYILKPIDAQALRASLARVAERQRLKLAKERSEAAFGTLVEAAPCMIVIVREDYSIAYFSRFAEELTGFAASAVTGENFLNTFFSTEDQSAFARRIHHVLLGKPASGFESQVRCQSGAPRWMIWNVRPLPYEDGPAILAVGQDITSVKQAQEQVLQSARLAAIGQMMTGLAHESGNALARSRTCLDLLASELQDRPDTLDLIQRIQKAQDHLQQLYEEVRGYAAPLRLERDVWNVAAIWRQVWQNLVLLRGQKKAQLHERVDGIDLSCSVDPFRMEQVFRNILENAFAACPEPIEVEVRCSEAQLDGRPALTISVRDNGPGLNAEQKRRIFEPFFTTKAKGTGLGMAIVKRIVEAHGGCIAVGPALAGGAEIVITLPRDERG